MKKNYNINELFELATLEAINLRELATPEQIANLDAELVNPSFTTSCIYGLMTGNCYSNKANKMIKECAMKVYEMDDSISNLGHSDLKIEVVEPNGLPRIVANRRAVFHSPIEVLIYNYPKNIPALIDFLKKKTNELILNT